ncbi:MAG TPA: VOC family protein [Chloroflexota bacterium]|nr:VOC family protein [Chloroflexota bacterium]
MPTVAGILESSLYVEDMGRSVAFYQAVFDFPIVLSATRLTTLKVSDRDVLILFKRGGSINSATAGEPMISGHDAIGEIHLAFAITAADLDTWRTRLSRHGIAIESEADWDGGSHSLYFRDPDRNLLEVVTPGIWSMTW